MLQVMAGGVACLLVWLLTLRIDESAVFYHLERFALYDDGRHLLAAATTLVSVNTLRAIFLYLGWFNLGESLSYSSRRWRSLSWILPLVAIPCCYSILPRVQEGFAPHFGAPALFCITTVIVLLLTTQELRGWAPRALVIVLVVFAGQWLDQAPSLSSWGFGGGELSTAVKDFAVLGEWDWVLDALACGMAFTACAGGIAVAALLVGANRRNVQFTKIRARDREIASLRENAIRARGYREIQQLVHDLKRPLTTILGLADVMAETLPPGPPAQYAKQIAETGASMNQMVEELLKENARQEVTVTALLEYVKSQISAVNWRHTVSVIASGEAANAVIRVNLIRFSRALVNLVENAHLAVQKQDEQKITVVAAVAGNMLELAVRDNGGGFSERFVKESIGDSVGGGQGSSVGVSEWGSTGIGLAFVEEVVKNHGGDMAIANTPEGGGRVTLRLPLPPALS